LQDAANQDISINSEPVDTSFIPNIKLGVVSSFTVLFSDYMKVGPEIGIYYGPSVLNIKSHGITIYDHCVNFSCCIRSTFVSTEIPSVAGNLSIGYDMTVFLSSSYKQHRNDQDLHDSFLGNKDLFQLLPDLPRVSGGFAMGFGLELPKGIYLVLKVKLPMELFLVDDRISKKRHQKPPQLDTDFIMINRAFTSNLLELGIGIDVLPWFKK